MLEKPDHIQDEQIMAGLRDEYGLHTVELSFLPLGADLGTAVYRAKTADHQTLFVKLRSGSFDPASVELPAWLHDQGIDHIIRPLTTQSGQLWAHLANFTLIVYPFVAGRSAYAVALSADQWAAFGATLKHIHSAVLPATISQHLQPEGYAAHAQASVRQFLHSLAAYQPADALASQARTFLQTHHAAILDLVARAERLAQLLQADPPPLVVCHADLHAGNLLISDQAQFYVVDWDTAILAPKERDLMFIGGAQGFVGYTPSQELELFYRGYGTTELDPRALAYYRYERIIQDIAIACEQLLIPQRGTADRAQELHYLQGNFLPNSTIEQAYRSDTNRWDQAQPSHTSL